MILLLASLVGCGSGSSGSTAPDSGLVAKSPKQIVEAAASALERVHSYHLEAAGTDADGRGRFVIDFARSGDLRMRIEHAAVGAYQALVVNSRLYMLGSKAFWRTVGEASDDASTGLFADRWIVMPADSMGDLGRNVAMLRPRNLAHCLRRSGAGTLTKRGTRSLEGTPVVVIATKGDRPGTAPGELSIAATGAPLPLRIVQTGPDRPGVKRDPRCGNENDTTKASDMRLSKFDEPVTVTAPKDAFDLNDLSDGN